VAERQGRNGWAAAHAGEATLREALFGNVTEARQRATKLLARSAEIDTEYLAGLALGAVRDTTRTQALADDLAERFPENTALKFYQIPTLRAQVALNHNDPVKAIELLEALKPYDLGYGGLYPAYLRGQAYLAARQGAEAAAQFQKIIDHRGLVNNMPIGALSRLQIGRAYAIQGDMAKAKAAYQDFLTLWKDADPDIPIYVAAHAEYAKLQ
jgi:tetratricopeptide (TPR) repeat protein